MQELAAYPLELLVDDEVDAAVVTTALLAEFLAVFSGPTPWRSPTTGLWIGRQVHRPWRSGRLNVGEGLASQAQATLSLAGQATCG
ncbi:hypothetical protein AB0L86_28615 [Micromonospora musae]|uniref:hypothetical protein n=1 Tax=Micromonospora musae TaxID=1894970 RepID=UPI003422F2B2